MEHISLTLPEEYPWILLSTGIIAFQCVFIGFGSGKRRKMFTESEAIKKKYGEEHKKYFKGDLPKGGYPDHGNGMYGDLLSYEEWYNF